IRSVLEHRELENTLAEALLMPHRSYFNLLYPYLARVKALVHITGGGFIENIPRILPDDLDAQIELNSWRPAPFWRLLQSEGGIGTEEMYRVFNMGIGMIAIVDQASAAGFQSSLPEPTFIIGKLVKGERKVSLN
ncbi:MAG TPA: AIR synthase-related protein, partial [Nitrospira sp.]|nr:AIR synthase-related protein [Nitrospira sp.]